MRESGVGSRESGVGRALCVVCCWCDVCVMSPMCGV